MGAVLARSFRVKTKKTIKNNIHTGGLFVAFSYP